MNIYSVIISFLNEHQHTSNNQHHPHLQFMLAPAAGLTAPPPDKRRGQPTYGGRIGYTDEGRRMGYTDRLGWQSRMAKEMK